MNDNNTQTIVIKEKSSFSYGIFGVITGFIGIFIFSVVLSPLAFILGVIGLLKGQIISSLFALIFSIFGLVTSPIVMGIIGLGALITIPGLDL